MNDKKSQVRSLMYANEGAVVLADDISRIIGYYLDDHAKPGDTKAAFETLSKYIEKAQAALRIVEKDGF